MKLNFVLKSLFFLVIISLFSCLKERIVGTGNISSQTLMLNSFTSIEVQNYCNVEIISSSENKVEFSDHENIIQYLKFEVSNNRLTIKTPDNVDVVNSAATAKIYTTSNLNEVVISGAGNVDIGSNFNTLSQCTISGSGNITAKYTNLFAATTVYCTISGSGNINLLKMQNSWANCSISGSGNISVAVVNHLDATISGSGNIEYLGSPVIVSSITGSGNLVKL